jgi:tetratricopeptide (TPR) repeat protein
MRNSLPATPAVVALLLLATGLFLPLSSCLSRPSNQPASLEEYPMQGMVYDDDNQPSAGAWIYYDGQKGPQTDIRGRFVLYGLARGVHRIEVRKDGYEPVDTTVEFVDRSQVLYLKVISLPQLLRRLEQALEDRSIQKAEELLRRAELIAAEDPVLLYLRAVYQLETGRAQEALKSLERVLWKGYRVPVVYLTMADIYQYHLQDPVRAAEHLAQYLRMQKDPEIQRRLEALQGGRS